ncbi:15258_t:CDS:10 [Entrophospora sp. SA101]|nr:15258_t:CDS:10 [Entrophospora sp. SA101]
MKSGEFAICKGGIEKFTRNWKLFTEGSLADIDWSNVFAAGGSVLSCLLPIPEEYNVSPRKIREYYHDKMYGSSDIDLFIYGLDEKAAMEKMLNIYDAVSNSVPWEVICIRSKNCITIISQYPYRHIQIVLRLYKSPSEILTGFDIDCCCVGFDGKDVWALPRAHRAITKQCNFVDLSRRSPSYEMRLAKYSDRGFEIKVQNLDRKRIDPTIYERSFEKLHGLARLLVLEKLNTPDERFGYAEKKRERSLRPNHPKAGTYASRTWQRRSNIGSSRFENSDYETDMVLNSAWYSKNKDRNLHRHPCFFGTMEQIFHDCCGTCPEPTTEEEKILQKEEDEVFIRGEISFIADDPGRQKIGSFHPLDDDDWAVEAYISPAREDLCSASAKGDLEIVKRLQTDNIDINARDYLGRTPLQLAVLGNHIELVGLLLEYGAKITARMIDGKTVIHLASQFGYLEILKLLFRKSDQNKNESEEQKYQKSLKEVEESFQNVNKDQDEDDDGSDESLEVIDKMEIDENLPPPKDKVNYGAKTASNQETNEEELENEDIIDINIESWDHSMAALDYAILFGQLEVVKYLINLGANVRRYIKIEKVPNVPSYYSINISKIYYPLSLCMLLINEKIGLQIATLLLENGAMVSQIDPKASRVINSLNSKYETPFLIAVQNGNKEIVELLLKNGAHAHITLEDCQDYSKRYNKSDGKVIYKTIKQPVTLSLENGLYKILIESGADINSLIFQEYRYSVINFENMTIRDKIESLIEEAQKRLSDYELKLDLKSNKGTTIIDNKDIINKYLEDLLVQERHKTNLNSYRSYLLKKLNVNDLYNFVQGTLPQYLSLINNNQIAVDTSTVHSVDQIKLEINKYEQLLIKYQECREYLLEKDAKRYKTIKFEEEKIISQKLIFQHQQELDNLSVLKSQAKTVDEKAKIIQQKKKNKEAPEQSTSTNISSVPSASSISPVIPINFDELLYEFEFLKFVKAFGHNIRVSDALKPDYIKLYQAIYDDNFEIVENLSKRVIIAVKDRNNITPFLWAVILGRNKIAITLLKIATAQYRPLPSDDDERDDKIKEEKEAFKKQMSSLVTLTIPSDNESSKFIKFKTQINVSGLELLLTLTKFDKTELFPKAFIKNHSSCDLDALKFATIKNNIELVKNILEWAKNYKITKDDNYMTADEKDGGLVTYLLRGNNYASYTLSSYSDKASIMEYAILFGHLDLLDLFIEFGVGGNNFAIFDIDDKKDGIIEIEKPKWYQGLDVDGSKKKSWVVHYMPNSHENFVQPSFLFYASFYGSIKSIEYFLSERPIKALEKFAKKKDNRKDNRLKVLSKEEDIKKVGRKIFGFFLFRNETPFHWAVQGNRPKALISLAESYKKLQEFNQQGLESLLDKKSIKDGMTALILAVKLQNTECLKILIELGADPGIVDDFGFTIAHYASCDGETSILKLLYQMLEPSTYLRMIEHGNKSFGHTPISYAIMKGWKDVLVLFIQQITQLTSTLNIRNNIYSYDFESNSYLHLSIKEGFIDLVKILLEWEKVFNEVQEPGDSMLIVEEAKKEKKGRNYLYSENVFGQISIEMAMQMILLNICQEQDLFIEENFKFDEFDEINRDRQVIENIFNKNEILKATTMTENIKEYYILKTNKQKVQEINYRRRVLNFIKEFYLQNQQEITKNGRKPIRNLIGFKAVDTYTNNCMKTMKSMKSRKYNLQNPNKDKLHIWLAQIY